MASPLFAVYTVTPAFSNDLKFDSGPRLTTLCLASDVGTKCKDFYRSPIFFKFSSKERILDIERELEVSESQAWKNFHNRSALARCTNLAMKMFVQFYTFSKLSKPFSKERYSWLCLAAIDGVGCHGEGIKARRCFESMISFRNAVRQWAFAKHSGMYVDKFDRDDSINSAAGQLREALDQMPAEPTDELEQRYYKNFTTKKPDSLERQLTESQQWFAKTFTDRKVYSHTFVVCAHFSRFCLSEDLNWLSGNPNHFLLQLNRKALLLREKLSLMGPSQRESIYGALYTFYEQASSIEDSLVALLNHPIFRELEESICLWASTSSSGLTDYLAQLDEKRRQNS